MCSFRGLAAPVDPVAGTEISQPAQTDISTEATTEATIVEPAIPVITREETLAGIASTVKRKVRIASNGQVLEDSAAEWDCVHDKDTGLTWEVKSNDGDRNNTNTYTWTQAIDKESVSWLDSVSGKCLGTADCDSMSYIEHINRLQLCNFDDWRLPSRIELESLIDMGQTRGYAKINTTLYPNTMASWYWTNDPHTDSPGHAWYIMLDSGTALSGRHDQPKHIRLVRGEL